MAAVALASAALAGAVVAVGVMWLARPTRVVHDATSVRTTEARTAAASFAPSRTSTAELAATLAPSLARVQVGHDDQWTSGTGVWLDEQGALLVATPLLGGDPSDAITVARDGEAPAPATVVGSDPATGVSVVRRRSERHAARRPDRRTGRRHHRRRDRCRSAVLGRHRAAHGHRRHRHGR
ncbi:MAG: hypothetical protein U0P45_16170 [Acidimicrobiales bacterium]